MEEKQKPIKVDKRKQSSVYSEKLAKARQKRIDNLNKKKQKDEYTFEESDSDSSESYYSSEEEIIIKPKKRKSVKENKKKESQKQEIKPDYDKKIDELTNVVYQMALSQKKQRLKKPKAKKITQIVLPKQENKKISHDVEKLKGLCKF